ncbi:MAG: tetratricopeptide repeat protein [Candidatus Hodarchaeales archaeon]|jgi:tetratricopeptide (TPR) repeat protein
MSIKEEFKQIKLFMYEGRYHKALQEVKGTENKLGLTDTEIILVSLLKCEIFELMGEYDQAIDLAHHLYQESKKLDKPLLMIDSIIRKCFSLLGSHKKEECNEWIEVAEGIITNIPKTQSGETKRRIAALFHLRGRINKTLDKLDKALEYGEKSLDLYKELGMKLDSGFTFHLLGSVYVAKGEMNRALEFFSEIMSIGETLNHMLLRALSYYSIGGVYLSLGELDDSIKYFQKCLALKDSLPFTLKEDTLNNIGIVLVYKGEIDQGLEYYQKSLAINEARNNKGAIAINLGNIGEVYVEKEDFSMASDCFKRALDIYRNLGHDWGIAEILYILISNFVSNFPPETILDHLDEFQEIYKRREDIPMITQKYRLTKAKVLKNSKRLSDKMKALAIFQEIAEEEIVWYELTISAMLNQSELLLFELKTTHDESVLNEVKILSNKLQSISKENNSYWLLTETYLLQYKLALMELNIESAQELLNEAEKIAKEKNFVKLLKTITIEQDLLVNQLEDWKRIIDQKPSIRERIELTQLETIFERMLNKKLYHNEEEIMEYAQEARSLVAVWGK